MIELEEKFLELEKRVRRANSPQCRNGFELGDAVRLPSIECVLEVVDLSDESLVGIRAPSGRVVRAGWRVLRKVKTK